MTPLAALSSLDLVGVALGALLTLMVFSYLLGHNPAYRLALHIFLGATTGYAFGVVTWEVFFLRVGVPLVVGRRWLVLVPLFLGLALLLKLAPRRPYLGNVSVGFLVGTGAGVAVSGAILGAVVPLVSATARAGSPSSWNTMPLGWLDGVLAVLGTAATVLAFRHVGRRVLVSRPGCAWPMRAVTRVGRWFLVVAFGALFGGALSTALSIFVGRVEFLIEFVRGLFG